MATPRMLIAALCLGSAATAQPPPRAQTPAPPLASFTSETLSRFDSDDEFDRYLEALEEAQNVSRRRWSAHRRPVQFAQVQNEAQSSDVVEPVCEDPALCPEPLIDDTDSGEGYITVTGSRVTASNPSITNNQMSGVDEGDIVKQIGQYLIVLQDGRLFVIDTRAGSGSELALVDRADVYRDREDHAWYDEMLVQGDRIVVTAYSYGEDASELSVFRLDERGRVHREGVFLISSDDYYSATNYATRLVGDSLVVYTPYRLERWTDYDKARWNWPTVRRWLPEERRSAAIDRGERLFDATRIHRPVREVVEPEIHTISVCPLGPVGAGRDLSCRTTAFIDSAQGQLYVTDRHAYLWTTPHAYQMRTNSRGACRAGEADGPEAAMPATLYRVGIADGALEVLAARGMPIDQFSFQASDARFYGMLRHQPVTCRQSRGTEQRLAFLSVPLSRFATRLRELPEDVYTPLPPAETYAIANRFTDRYLVYGSLSHNNFDPEYPDEFRVALPRAYAVPVDRPQRATRLPVPHNVLRAERAGDDIVLTGYRDRTGLRISLVDLRRAPRVASTAHLRNRYESEGRSHAFNSLMEGDGSGIMGIPTVYYDNSRPVWRSEASDVSYLTADAAGALTPVGELSSGERDGDPSYRCEVSCIDWYGNSRPIFTDGRIFGLTGTELVEGRLAAGRIAEIRRLDLTTPPSPR